MFYRLRFDGFVGGILKLAGYLTTEKQLDFWPMGESVDWVAFGKERKLRPVETAAIAVCEVARDRVAVGSISKAEAQFLASMASKVAKENGARPEPMRIIFDCVANVTKSINS